uniref:Oxysterol binding protein n=1 Tax=Lotharella oceanica TaxID=641309 RepID=A0A7S2TI12_9EUKA
MSEKKVSLKKLVKPWPESDKTEFGFEDVVRGQYGGCKFVAKDGLSLNRTVITHLVSSMGKNIMEGKSIINISLPVTIFEPRSFLQRMTDHWAFAPLYLNKAAMAKDPVERFKWAIAFMISGLHNGCRQKKPFNPILGETFQATYPDGTEIFLEQVSHHPPVSQYELLGPNGTWKLCGFNEYRASFRPNGVVGGQYGPNKIEFQDGTVIEYTMPQVTVSGMVIGDWLFYWTGTTTFVDRKNNITAEITFDPDAANSVISYATSFFSAKSPCDYFKGSLKKDGKEICPIEGCWLAKLKFQEKVYWRIRQYLPFTPTELEKTLPSHATKREDLVALLQGNVELSQTEKKRLEEKQRADRKLRKEHGPKKDGH